MNLGTWRAMQRRHDDLVAAGALDDDDDCDLRCDALIAAMATPASGRLGIAQRVRLIADLADEGSDAATTRSYCRAILISLRRRELISAVRNIAALKFSPAATEQTFVARGIASIVLRLD